MVKKNKNKQKTKQCVLKGQRMWRHHSRRCMIPLGGSEYRWYSLLVQGNHVYNTPLCCRFICSIDIDIKILLYIRFETATLLTYIYPWNYCYISSLFSSTWSHKIWCSLHSQYYLALFISIFSLPDTLHASNDLRRRDGDNICGHRKIVFKIHERQLQLMRRTDIEVAKVGGYPSVLCPCPSCAWCIVLTF